MRVSRIGKSIAGLGVLLTALGLAAGATATAANNPVTYVGNVTTCAQVGLAGSTQYDGSTASGVDAGALFTVTVTDSRYITISNIAPGVVFQAVVVKGGNGYNVYNPLLPDMRSPDTTGGTVPALSHWFACYTYVPPSSTTTTAPEVTTTTAPEVTTTTAPEVTTTTAPEVTTTTEPEVDSGGPTTTTTVSTTASTTTTVELASGGPTTTTAAGSLPRTGGGSGADGLVVLGLVLACVGLVLAMQSRRSLAS